MIYDPRLSSSRGSRVNQFVSSSRVLPHTWIYPTRASFHEVCPWHKSHQRSVVLIMCSIGHARLVCRHNVIYYFAIAISIHVPIPTDFTDLCILSHTDASAIAETSVVRFLGSHVTKTHLEDVNYYGTNLLFSNCLRIVVMLTLNTFTHNKTGIRWV